MLLASQPPGLTEDVVCGFVASTRQWDEISAGAQPVPWQELSSYPLVKTCVKS